MWCRWGSIRGVDTLKKNTKSINEKERFKKRENKCRQRVYVAKVGSTGELTQFNLFLKGGSDGSKGWRHGVGEEVAK